MDPDAAHGRPDPGSREPVGRLILEWQETAATDAFERLVAGVMPTILATVKATLRSLRIGDPAAVDDAIALVLDHLRRLPGAAPTERQVTPFVLSPTAAPAADLGVAYLRTLARDRAGDVARAGRRRARRVVCFCDLDRARGVEPPPASDAADVAHEDDRPATAGEVIGPLLGRLPPRDRAVIDLLLEGRTQRAIAALLDLSEGTVSRIRGRAVLRLRRLLADRADAVS